MNRIRMKAGLLAAGLWVGLGTAGFAAEAGMAQAIPQMGPHVLIFTPQMKAAAVQAEIDRVYAEQEHSEFGSGRVALVFLPGTYRVDVPVGFYTEVVGLGAGPDAVQIVGNVHADASLPHNNATCTFWRSLEGLAVTPAGGTMQWAVSQAAPFRRMHVEGSMVLHQQHGWASGGWMADVLVNGNVDSGTQQQWMARNSAWGSWTGANWNMVFVGDRNAPTGEWPKPPYTKVAATPVVREKPFLMVDGKGAWSVRVPALRRESVGNTWGRGETPGQSIPLGRFYIAQAGKDTAATMNAALGRGMHLLLTPGIYELEQPLRVTRAGTVVLGLGFATLKPVKGTAALTTADVDGVDIAGVLVDAGETRSPVLMRVGEAGSKRSHAANPICLHDVFFRVGGAGAGSAGVNLEVNSRDTIIDHTWIWRADHGKGVGWTVNPSDNGLVVNGENVMAYGLFVEHHERFQVLWKGEGGRTYFYQSEIPYDPPDQASYTSAPGTHGWASYKVADGVKTHEAWGMGVYSVFLKPHVTLTRAMETPKGPGIRFHDMITVALGNLGAIENVIDDAGGATSIEPRVTPQVTAFP